MCRTDFSAKELSEDVYINKVGTFGVSSAGYWWGRAGGAIMRRPICGEGVGPLRAAGEGVVSRRLPMARGAALAEATAAAAQCAAAGGGNGAAVNSPRR